MLLRELVNDYVTWRNNDRPVGRDLSSNTRRHLLECVGAFSSWLDRPATLCDLTAEAINRFLAALIESGRSPYTAKNRRTGLLVLLRFAVAQKIGSGNAAGVSGVYCPSLQIEGYSADQMAQLIEAATRLRGSVRGTGIARAIYWRSAIMTEWDLGLRAGDMVKLRVADFDSAGLLWVLERKTGKQSWRRLRPSLADLIRECIAANPKRRLIWPGLRPRSFYRAFKRLATSADLPGTSRWVRRGAASEVERLRPGSGWRFLNHSIPALFEKHYRVARICDAEALAPPQIGGTG